MGDQHKGCMDQIESFKSQNLHRKFFASHSDFHRRSQTCSNENKRLFKKS